MCPRLSTSSGLALNSASLTTGITGAVENRPLKFTDPTGHDVDCASYDYACKGQVDNEHLEEYIRQRNQYLDSECARCSKGGADCPNYPEILGFTAVSLVGTAVLPEAAATAVEGIQSIGNAVVNTGYAVSAWCLTTQICARLVGYPIANSESSATTSPRVESTVERLLKFSPRNPQHEYDRHAGQLGFQGGNWNTQNAQAFQQFLIDHVQAPATQAVPGTYRGTLVVIHYFNPYTGIDVMTDLNGTMKAALNLSAQQIYHLYRTGNVQ